MVGHRPSVRRGSCPGPRVRAGPRSWHTRQQGGPTPPNTGTRRARPRVHREAGCHPSAQAITPAWHHARHERAGHRQRRRAQKRGDRQAITGSLDTRGWRLYDGAIADHRARTHDREENPLCGKPLWLLRATARQTAPRAGEGAGVDRGRRVGAAARVDDCTRRSRCLRRSLFPPQTVQRYRQRRPHCVGNEPWPTMLRPSFPRVSHPRLAQAIPSIACIARYHRRTANACGSSEGRVRSCSESSTVGVFCSRYPCSRTRPACLPRPVGRRSRFAR